MPDNRLVSPSMALTRFGSAIITNTFQGTGGNILVPVVTCHQLHRFRLGKHPSCAFRFAFAFFCFTSFLDSVITADSSFQNSALASSPHPAHPTTSFRRAWSADFAPLFLCAFAFAFLPCHNVTSFLYLTQVFPVSKFLYQMPVCSAGKFPPDCALTEQAAR